MSCSWYRVEVLKIPEASRISDSSFPQALLDLRVIGRTTFQSIFFSPTSSWDASLSPPGFPAILALFLSANKKLSSNGRDLWKVRQVIHHSLHSGWWFLKGGTQGFPRHEVSSNKKVGSKTFHRLRHYQFINWNLNRNFQVLKKNCSAVYGSCK